MTLSSWYVAHPMECLSQQYQGRTQWSVPVSAELPFQVSSSAGESLREAASQMHWVAAQWVSCGSERWVYQTARPRYQHDTLVTYTHGNHICHTTTLSCEQYPVQLCCTKKVGKCPQTAFCRRWSQSKTEVRIQETTPPSLPPSLSVPHTLYGCCLPLMEPLGMTSAKWDYIH